MQQEIIHPQIEKYTLYSGPVTDDFAPSQAGITYPDPDYEMLCFNRPVYVFEYVLNGTGHIELNGTSFTVKKGDAYILHSHTEHHYYADPSDPWEKIWFNVSGNLVLHLLSAYGIDNVCVIPGFQDAHYLQEIIDTMSADPLHSADKLALLLHSYIQALSHFQETLKLNNPVAQNIRNYIDLHLTHPLTIDALASYANLSRSRVLHLFQEVYHVSPYQYYMTQKLKLAQSLLLSTTLSVSDISLQLGFLDPHHFSSFFKKQSGISPAAYRKEHRSRKSSG